MLYKLYDKVKSIYRTDIVFFILLFVLYSITDVYYNVINAQYFKCLYNIVNAFFFSSFTCIALSYTNKYKNLRNLLNIIAILFVALYSVINGYSISLTLKTLNFGIIELLISTNYNETIEFFKAYLSIYHILLIIIVFTFIIRLSCRKHLVNNSSVVNLLSVIFVFCTIMVILNPYSIHDTPIGRLYIIFRDRHRIELAPDLSLYKRNPEFIAIRDKHPENIIVIIGESFAKTHSSLYGYSKTTNPLLDSHQKDSNLYVFNNIVAPASHTIEVFKAIMSTFSYNRDDKEWYRHTTIPECFNLLGYKTIWISNQHQYGAFDNIPTRYSQLCDTAIFTKQKITDNFKDEQVLKYIDEKPLKKELYIIHLMGQHFKCSERYPNEFDCFVEDDYLDLPQHQRKIVAEYDNATLYNDFVIDSIIKVFGDKESIIFYIPDHGQDIFYSDDNYYGHGIVANEKSDSIGRDIPFMIYTSQKFKSSYQDLNLLIKKSIDRKSQFNTEDLIYTLIDVVGYKFKDNEDVETHSILGNELMEQ